MDILIDTQILIWSFDSNSPLSASHKSVLEDPTNRIFVSQISLMELAIKKNINKLPSFLPSIDEVTAQILRTGFEILRLSDEQIASFVKLPLIDEHKDPFDRFLIAIANHEQLAVVTADSKFKLYSALITLI